MYEPDLTVARTILTNLYAMTHSATANSISTMIEADAAIAKLTDEQVLAKMEALKYVWDSLDWNRTSDNDDFEQLVYKGYKAQKGRHLLYFIWKHIKENAEDVINGLDNEQVCQQLENFNYDFDGEKWERPRMKPRWAESKEDQDKAEMLRNARIVIQLKWNETQEVEGLTSGEVVGMMTDREVMSWMTRWNYAYDGKVWRPQS